MLPATIGGAPIPHVTSCNLKHLAMPGPPKQTVQYRERLGMDQTKVNTINTKKWPDFRGSIGIPISTHAQLFLRGLSICSKFPQQRGPGLTVLILRVPRLSWRHPMTHMTLDDLFFQGDFSP